MKLRLRPRPSWGRRGRLASPPRRLALAAASCRDPWCALIAGLTLGAGVLGRLTALPPGRLPLIEPAAGMAAVALMLWGPRYWPGVFLAFLMNALAWTGAEFATGPALAWALAIAAADTLEASAAAWLVCRWVGLPGVFDRVGSLATTLALAGACASIGGLITGLALAQTALPPQLSALDHWMSASLANLLGFALVMPFGVSLALRKPPRWEAGLLECLAIAAAALALTYGVFWDTLRPELGYPYLLIPVVIWGAARTDSVGTALTVGAIGSGALWASAAGRSLFFGEPRPGAVLSLQLYLGALGLAGYVLSAASNQFKRAAAELAESERRFRATFEQAAVGVAHVGLDGRWLRMNRRLCEMLGYECEELLGRRAEESLLPGEPPLETGEARRVLDGRVAHCAVERRFRRRDGLPIWLQATVSVVRDGLGKPDYFLWVLEDATERRRAQEELERLNRELEARVARRTSRLKNTVAELESFSYTITHDLRAPLRALEGFSQLLRRRLSGRGDEESESLLRRIADAAARMDRLTRDVLTYSAIARGELRLSPVDLDALAQHVVAHYPQLSEQRVEIRGRLGHILGREPLIMQALSNLLINAVKFVPAGKRPRVELWSESAGGRVRVVVRDNGIGIPPEFHERIFAPFQRLPDAKHVEGSGIGLAIVKKAVERMGGRVGVDSAPGEGARFWFELPKAPGK